MSVSLAIFPPCKAAADETETGGGKFVPPPGKTLVAIGAGWDEIAAYTKLTRHRPLGVKFYNSLRDEGNVHLFRQNARKNIPSGGFLVMETDLNGITDEGIRRTSSKPPCRTGLGRHPLGVRPPGLG